MSRLDKKRKAVDWSVQSGGEDPGLSTRGEGALEKLKTSHKELLSQITLAYVSPLYRAMQTALLALPWSAKIYVTKDAAEIMTDKFTKDGLPREHHKQKVVTTKSPEQTGHVRRELLEMLGDLAGSHRIEWLDIKEEERWWEGKPPTKSEIGKHIDSLLGRVKASMQEGERVAIVGHSMWMKVAVPFHTRPKGTPNPLGTAAHFWPSNSTPYLASLCRNKLHLHKKLSTKDKFSGLTDIMLLRHGHSEAQMTRTNNKRSKKKADGSDAATTSDPP